jgi:hypothetical protein
MPEANPARAAPALDRGRRKGLGAYYTALPVVELLVIRATRSRWI